MRFAARGSVRSVHGRRAVGVAVAAALLGGATACGTEAQAEAKPKTPAEAVARAAERTTEVTSLRYRVRGTLPGHGKVRAEASMGVRPSVLRMEVTGLGASEEGSVQIRFVDDAMYTEVDETTLGDAGFVGVETAGRHWFRAAPAAWGGLSVDNQSYRILPRQLEGSPLVQSTILNGAEDVREAGTEEVDGTRTTRYRGTVTAKGLRAARGTAKGKKAQELWMNSFDQFMGLGLKVGSALAMELWVDEDGRTRQFRLRGETSTLDKKGRWVDTGPLDMTVTFLAVDPSVSVEPPAADDTVDLDEVVGRPGSG
ncbi:hypothetical protein [Streptomyces sp. AC495_CC817]|uniref:hypothetical protein n=1 Tax=Streptomyces sp. AC495_CC817 TaxID=2823900 RepID=UPI001C25E208|nr:hypothetical protein [Streptomyces sp. AC495_CC817]